MDRETTRDDQTWVTEKDNYTESKNSRTHLVDHGVVDKHDNHSDTFVRITNKWPSC